MVTENRSEQVNNGEVAVVKNRHLRNPPPKPKLKPPVFKHRVFELIEVGNTETTSDILSLKAVSTAYLEYHEAAMRAKRYLATNKGAICTILETLE